MSYPAECQSWRLTPKARNTGGCYKIGTKLKQVGTNIKNFWFQMLKGWFYNLVLRPVLVLLEICLAC